MKNYEILIISIIVFLIFIWIQRSDKKNKNKVKNLFDKIKNPLLITSLIVFALTYSSDNKISNNIKIPKNILPVSTNFVQEVFTGPPTF
jgi:predicted permease